MPYNVRGSLEMVLDALSHDSFVVAYQLSNYLPYNGGV